MNNQTDGGSPCSVAECKWPAGRPDETEQIFKERQAPSARLSRIEHKILILSGKGGVGKSTIAANLSMYLALSGFRIGLLDIDITAPSIPRILGLEERRVTWGKGSITPVLIGDAFQVISLPFLREAYPEELLSSGRARGRLIKSLFEDAKWGDLDYLVVDSPPGNNFESLSIAPFMEGSDGAVVVTTPQALSVDDARRSIALCRQCEVPILGVIENMSGVIYPYGGNDLKMFGAGGGEKLASETGIEFLGKLPFDPAVVEASDVGRPHLFEFLGTRSVGAFEQIVRRMLEGTRGYRGARWGG